MSDEERVEELERALEEARRERDKFVTLSNDYRASFEEQRRRAKTAERQLVEARQEGEAAKETALALIEWAEQEKHAWPASRSDALTELIDSLIERQFTGDASGAIDSHLVEAREALRRIAEMPLADFHVGQAQRMARAALEATGPSE